MGLLNQAALDNAQKVYQAALLISHLRAIKVDAGDEALDNATAGNWLAHPANTNLIQARIADNTIVDANCLAVLEDFAGAPDASDKKIAWNTINANAGNVVQKVLEQARLVNFSLADFRLQRHHEHSETRIARD